LNTLKTTDPSKLAKAIEEMQEETTRRLNMRKTQLLHDFNFLISNDIESLPIPPKVIKPSLKASELEQQDNSDPLQKYNFDPMEIPSSINLPIIIEWLWNDDKGGFKEYDTKTSLLLEKEYQKDKKGSVHLTHDFYGASPQGYMVDFNTMRQTKLETGWERSVQRRTSWIKLEDHRRKIHRLQDKMKLLELTQPQPEVSNNLTM